MHKANRKRTSVSPRSSQRNGHKIGVLTRRICTRLIKAREAAGLTRAELAKKAGLSLRQIYRYEFFYSTIRVLSLERLINALGLSFYYFTCDEKPAFAPRSSHRQTLRKNARQKVPSNKADRQGTAARKNRQR